MTELELLRKEEAKHIRRERARMVLCLGLAIILTSSAVTITFYFAKMSLGRSRNVIMMVSDGFGPASQTYGRSFYQYKHNLAESKLTPLDEILVGTSRTRSSDSLVTDSAAGATAFSCALKTYNGAIGVDPTGNPCGTILEAAKDLGMLTGLVVTSRITHATPASFSAHVIDRDMESEIAAQQIGDYPLTRQIDLMLGGGRCFFLPNTTQGSCRTDGRDLIKEAKEEYGWKVVLEDRGEFEALNNILPLPAMGLFHLDHMNYEIDRMQQANETKEPSLSEMTIAALTTLKDVGGMTRGFFLMIEGSRIDMGGHNNDPVAHLHEILEYHKTVAVVKKFIEDNPDTLVISTSDHETGGFTLGNQDDPDTFPEYLWRPEVIDRATASTEKLTLQLYHFNTQSAKEPTQKEREQFVRTQILDLGLGITDPTPQEIAFLSNKDVDYLKALPFLGHAISRRASLGWTTLGHTGVDVNLYAMGDGYKNLLGNRENTDIGVVMADYLKVDLSYITRKLQKTAGSWFKSKEASKHFSASTGRRARSQHQKSGH
ncbi:MAG: alkaline phosphatase [Linnemannia gamsii]|nr:MAG: alkaline phosphatase [Linnemannia gamsii]